MSNTTPDAIFASLEAMLVALTPSGGTAVGDKSGYALIDEVGYVEDSETTAASEMDRQIQLHPMTVQGLDLEGLTTTNATEGQFDLVIGHTMGDYRKARDRMMKDVQQIIAQMIHPTTTTAIDGVMRIWFDASGYEMVRDGTFFWTTLRFGIEYASAADYGG